MRRAWLGLLIGAALSAAAGGAVALSAQGDQPSGELCAFAVLRRDGIIIPFATFEQGRWRNRWPEGGRKIDVPISVEQTPKGWWPRERPVATWTGWPAQGESRALHVRNPISLVVECTRQLGLQTDYSSTLPPVPPGMQPHPKDGLATTGDVVVEPVEVLTEKSADWGRVVNAIRLPFEASEARAAAKLPPRRPERDPVHRAQFPLELEVLARSAGLTPGSQMFYVEAVRRYSRRPKGTTIQVVPDGQLLAYGAGWLELGADGKLTPQLPMTVEVSDNRRENLLYMMPLGAFTIGGRRYWGAQRAGWGYERYEVLEMTSPEVKLTLNTMGGSCR